LEQEEENRETQLHAHESGETRTGRRPEIVAVEQLPFLSVRREEHLYIRSRTEVAGERQRRTLCKNRKGCGTPNFSCFNQRQTQLQARGGGSATRQVAISDLKFEISEKGKSRSLVG